MKNKIFVVLAWMQIFLSLSLAGVLILGYVSFQSSTGKLIHSIATSIGAVSNVVIRTAETVETRTELLEQSGQMLVVTRKQLQELQAIVKNNAALAPQMAASLRSTSQLANRLGTSLASFGDTLAQISVPTAVQMDGLRPVIVMSRPLALRGEELRKDGKNILEVGNGLAAASDSVARDTVNASNSFVASTEQALKVLVEVENTLARVKSQDLPKAVSDLKFTAENLRNISEQVDLFGNVGIILLIGGLILSAWCFLHSLNALVLARSLHYGQNRVAP
jgi:hypothetical protein